jgi:hypothetical protein
MMTPSLIQIVSPDFNRSYSIIKPTSGHVRGSSEEISKGEPVENDKPTIWDDDVPIARRDRSAYDWLVGLFEIA